MARTAALMEPQPTGCRSSQDTKNDRGREAPPNGDVLTEQISEGLKTLPQDEVFKEIASLPPSRRDKVLDIRLQLAEGTYETTDRLDKVIDRVLEAITA